MRGYCPRIFLYYIIFVFFQFLIKEFLDYWF